MLRVIKNPLIVFFIVIIALFFGYQVYLVSFAAMRTEIVTSFIVDDVFTVSGIFVRDEQSILAEADAVVDYSVSNGQKVAKNAVIGYLHKNAQQAEIAAEIRVLNERLKRLKDVQSSTLQYVQDIVTIEKGITNSIMAISEKVSSGDYSNMTEYKDDLMDLFYKKLYITNQTDVVSVKIYEITAKITELSNKYGTVQKPYYSPASGFYVYNIDGFENLIKPENLKNISFADAEALFLKTPEQTDIKYAGKIVSSFDWRYVFITDQENIKEYKASTADGIVGDEIQMRVSGKSSNTIMTTIESITPAENGKVAVVVIGNTEHSMISAIRKNDAQFIKKRYTGLKVSTQAIRTVKGEVGVFVVSGTLAKFKPINILVQNNDFCVVESKTSDTKQILLSDDEVIVSARDLFDGKVIK